MINEQDDFKTTALPAYPSKTHMDSANLQEPIYTP